MLILLGELFIWFNNHYSITGNDDFDVTTVYKMSNSLIKEKTGGL